MQIRLNLIAVEAGVDANRSDAEAVVTRWMQRMAIVEEKGGFQFARITARMSNTSLFFTLGAAMLGTIHQTVSSSQ